MIFGSGAGRRDGDPQRGSDPYSRDSIAPQLQAFAEEQGIKSLEDRLNFGLNEVAVLAVERTRKQIRETCELFAEYPEQADIIYQDVLDMCVIIQEAGPWEYAKELSESKDDPAAQVWYIVRSAIVKGYESIKELSSKEFAEDVKRIESNLQDALKDPDKFWKASRDYELEESEETIRFHGDDEDERVPIGETFSSFLPMALRGYEAGVVQDHEGWVYVGARGEISDELVESCGLEAEVGPDDRISDRTVTWYKNESGQKVAKKLHPGFIIVVSQSLELARAIVQAINDENDVIEVSEEAIGHLRVIQTSEGQFDEELAEEMFRKKFFLRHPGLRRPTEEKPEEESGEEGGGEEPGELLDLRSEFYERMLYIRSLYVYLDKLTALQIKKDKAGRELTERDRDRLMESTSNKMEQKVDELRYVNDLIQEELNALPAEVRSVIDMAGGAGDLGLAVSNQILARGRDLRRVEIVDPQEGTDRFMDTIIKYLPFREKLEEIAHHNTAYLQDAEITPDSMVVAKHACGTLADSIVKDWVNSDSKVLVIMTCCQEKARHEVARYGFSQDEWHKLCVESAGTGVKVPDTPGRKRDVALRKLERGKQAMLTLDQARVDYLRRHGFKAELHTTDKFPKGDVIVARRLPENFMDKLAELQRLGRDDKVEYHKAVLKLKKLAVGGDIHNARADNFGEEWVDDDFAELLRRFTAKPLKGVDFLAQLKEEETLAKEEAERKAKEAEEKKRRRKAMGKVMKSIFPEIEGGKVHLYVQERGQRIGRKVPKKEFGVVIKAIQGKIASMEGSEPAEIRAAVDTLMEEMGY